MSAFSRILLVEDTPTEWGVALSGLSETGLEGETTVVKDQDEALDFLHARGPFRRRPSGLPAVLVVGPSVQWAAALSLLKQVRADPALRRMPVVIIAACPDADMVQSAYDHGVNSLVRREGDIESDAQRYAALGLFWGWANEPPPGCLVRPKSERRLA
jgi:two-component system, response regulator